MKLRLLNRRQAKEIYDRYLVRDFPDSERKPFASMAALLRKGMYEPLAVEDDGGSLAGYAFLMAQPGSPSALLDYFAVLPAMRGQGLGTKALQALAGYLAPSRRSLLIECEHPAEAPDAAVARQRVAFYLRAGARATAMESRLFGVRYLILVLPCAGPAPDTEACADLRALYRATVPEPYYRGQVIFYGGTGKLGT